jgi:hypothetical protein
VGCWGIVAYVAAIIIHELLHGVGFMIAGARPKFGVGIAGFLPIAYATSNNKVRVPNMLLVGYLPLFVLSLICVAVARVFPEYQTYALIGFIGNFSGAVGDIWITSKLWKYLPYKDALVYDSKSGCDVYSNNPGAATKGMKAAKKAKDSGAFGKNWAVSSLVIMIVQLFSPSLLPLLGFNRSLTLGFGEFYFFKTEIAANGDPQAVTFNLLAPLLIGLVLALVIKATVSKRTRA